jgi:hypothetical protein
MMRFRGRIEQRPAREKSFAYSQRQLSLLATNWPTVDELEAVTAPMTADTILQILRGDGIFRGWDCTNPDEFSRTQLKRRAAALDYAKESDIVDTRSRVDAKKKELRDFLSERSKLQGAVARSRRKLRFLDRKLERIAKRINRQRIKERGRLQIELRRKEAERRGELMYVYRRQSSQFRKTIRLLAHTKKLTLEQATQLFLDMVGAK